MEASVSSGREPFCSATRSTTLVSLSASLACTVSCSVDGDAGAGDGVTELGRMVTIGSPRVTLDVTIVEPAKITCVAVPSGVTATASVSSPLSSLTASRPAISLPSWVEASRTAAGWTRLISSATAVALGATR
jgi:hypothetical protein